MDNVSNIVQSCPILTSHELISKTLINLGILLSLLVLLVALGGPLLVEDGLLGVGQLGSLLSSKGQSIVGLIPRKRKI